MDISDPFLPCVTVFGYDPPFSRYDYHIGLKFK
jgi:hypothetical protein